MSSSEAKRTGRRPGTTETRERIAVAARAQFAEHGYAGATFRRVAAAAGVDPALVVHFFGSKENLFREVMALPPAIADGLLRIASEPRPRMGRALAEVVVAAMEGPVTRPILLGRIRSATTHPEAAALVRETVTRDLQRLTSAITEDQPEMRAVLIGAHIAGVALARYVVLVEPLGSMSANELVTVLEPTFQRFLAEPL
jgi:AcrR family transcriptional regulator